MIDAPTTDLLFEPLTKCVKSKSCVAVIGAGLSAGDYPLWSELCADFISACRLSPSDVSGKGDAEIAEIAKNRDAAIYFATLDKHFCHDRPASLAVARKYHLLARAPFISYLNLNFDCRLLDVHHLHRNVAVSEFPDLRAEYLKKKECYYLHGRLGPGRSARKAEIVLTSSEFELAYDPSKNMLHSFLQQTFLTRDVCFLGCNPSEPSMSRILKACNEFCNGNYGFHVAGRPRWFLVWGELSTPPELKDTGIQLVRFPMHDGSYIAFEKILAHWAGEERINYRLPKVARSTFDDSAEVLP